MKGQRLFNDLMKAGMTAPVKRGRNDELNHERNACLAARYYYYGHLKECKYEEIISLLVREFFISPSRINRIVQDHADKISEMKTQKITRYKLGQTWPHLKWVQ